MAEKAYTKEEVDKYIAYVREQNKGKSPEELGRYEEYIRQTLQPKTTAQKIFEHPAVDYPLRALDYLGGLSRATAAGAADVMQAPFTGDYKLSSEDIIRALKGKGPTTGEYMKKFGIPEGGSMSEVFPSMYSPTGDEWTKFQKGGPLDVTTRGFAGFLGDVALDPLTYLTMGAAPALKEGAKGTSAVSKAIDVATSPIKTLVPPVGKSIYKSGLKKIDQEAAKMGKEPVSDLLLQEGITGSADSIFKQMNELGEKLLAERNKILQWGTNVGAEVSMEKAMAPALAKAAEIRKNGDPALQPLADALEATAKKYLEQGAKPAYSEVKITPPSEVVGSLPRGGVYQGAHTPIEIIPPKEVLGSLPQPGQWSGARSNVEIIPPLLDVAPVPSGLDPYAALIGYPGKKAELPQMSVLRTEKGKTIRGETLPDDIFTPKPEVPFYDVIPGEVIPKPTVPDKFTQLPEVPTYERIPGETIPGKTFEAVPGPDPLKASGWKTSLYNMFPESVWKDPSIYGSARSAEKTLSGGMKTAVEDAIEKALGKAQAEKVADLNEKLGQILTTKERQAAEAAKEMNKPLVTQVTGGMAGAIKGSQNAAVKEALLSSLIGKELVRALQFTWPKTKIGKSMYGLRETSIPDTLLRRSLIEGEQP